MNAHRWQAHNTQGVKGWAVAEQHPSGDGSFYAPLVQGLSEAEARFIVEACNQHAALKLREKALEELLEAFSAEDSQCDIEAFRKLKANARSALAQTKL